MPIDKDKIVSQEGMGKLYVASRPPADAIVSTDGSIYGGSTVTFSDLLANHMFTVSAYQVRDFRSMAFNYVNLSRRLQWAVSAYQYTLFYYPDFYYYDPSLWNFTTYQDALSTRRITGANDHGLLSAEQVRPGGSARSGSPITKRTSSTPTPTACRAPWPTAISSTARCSRPPSA